MIPLPYILTGLGVLVSQTIGGVWFLATNYSQFGYVKDATTTLQTRMAAVELAVSKMDLIAQKQEEAERRLTADELEARASQQTIAHLDQEISQFLARLDRGDGPARGR